MLVGAIAGGLLFVASVAILPGLVSEHTDAFSGDDDEPDDTPEAQVTRTTNPESASPESDQSRTTPYGAGGFENVTAVPRVRETDPPATDSPTSRTTRTRVPTRTPSRPAVVYNLSYVEIELGATRTLVRADIERLSSRERVDVNISAEVQSESGEVYANSESTRLDAEDVFRTRVADHQIREIAAIRIWIDGEEIFAVEPQGDSEYRYHPGNEICFRNCPT